MSQISPFVACIELARYAKLRGVAFRVLADGTVETDSVEEALKLRRALLRENRKQAAPDRKVPDPDNLSEDTKQFLYAVVRPATSDEIAETVKIKKKSLPPLIRGLNVWAEHRGLNLDELLTRTQKSVKGKPVSTYELTERGCAQFAPFLPLLKAGMNARTSDRAPSVPTPRELSDLAGRLCQPHQAPIQVSSNGRLAICKAEGAHCDTKALLAYVDRLNAEAG
jgi:hypothetical protein